MQPEMFTEATIDDCETLAAFATKSFNETFGHLYRPENLALHTREKNSAEFFCHSLEAGDTVLKLQDGTRIIGYAKVGRVSLPVKPLPRGSQEIHRVYIDKEFQGRGLGKALMLHILSLPRVTAAPVVYLGVWEENIRAQHMYTLFGFEFAGRYLYHVGDQSDREIIMTRTR
ncbi:MAG: GNAT family N-acetyltransferase [Rickettsiales bacterium]